MSSYFPPSSRQKGFSLDVAVTGGQQPIYNKYTSPVGQAEGLASKKDGGVAFMEAAKRERLHAEQLAREQLDDAYRGVWTRLTPEPTGALSRFWSIFLWIGRGYLMFATVAAGLNLGGVWSAGGPDQNRWYQLTALIFIGVQWLMSFAAMLTGTANERYAQETFHSGYGENWEILEKHITEVRMTGVETKASGSPTLFVVDRPGMFAYQRNAAAFREAIKASQESTTAGDDTAGLVEGINGKKQMVRLPWPNLPRPALGLMYQSCVLVGISAEYYYYYILINNNDTNLGTYNYYRDYRVYQWLYFGILLLDNIIALVDYWNFWHAAMTGRETIMQACTALKMSFEEMAPFPDVAHIRVFHNFVRDNTTVYCIVLIVLYAWQLSGWDPTNGAIINTNRALRIEFTTWVIFGTLLFGDVVMGILSRHHACAFRTYVMAGVYWGALWAWTFTVYYLRLQDYNANDDGLLNTGDLYRFENKMWVFLLALSTHVYFTNFRKLRHQVCSLLQLAWCPNMHDW
jgi:hypothetical protein